MGRKIGYAVVLAAALIPVLCGRAYGQKDPKPTQLPAYYHPIDLLGQKEAPNQRGGFKKMQKQVSKRSAAYLTSKMGENYFTQRIAPIVLKSVGLRSPVLQVLMVPEH